MRIYKNRAPKGNDSIKEWYASAYKDDEMGAEIRPEAKFSELEDNVGDAYGYIGPQDTLIRERVFGEWSKRNKKDYAHIYNKWLDAMRR